MKQPDSLKEIEKHNYLVKFDRFIYSKGQILKIEKRGEEVRTIIVKPGLKEHKLHYMLGLAPWTELLRRDIIKTKLRKGIFDEFMKT